MQKNADKMRTRRIEPKQLVIQRMGKPRQWMPVRSVVSSECPFHRVPTETSSYVCVFGDVMVVVKIDKGIVPNRQVGEHGQQNQRKSEDESPLTWRRKQFVCFQRSFRICDVSCDRGHCVLLILSCRKCGH